MYKKCSWHQTRGRILSVTCDVQMLLSGLFSGASSCSIHSWDSAHLVALCCHHLLPAHTAARRDPCGSPSCFLSLSAWRQRLPRTHTAGFLRGVPRVGGKIIPGVNQRLANPSRTHEAGCSGTSATQVELTGVFGPLQGLDEF